MMEMEGVFKSIVPKRKKDADTTRVYSVRISAADASRLDELSVRAARAGLRFCAGGLFRRGLAAEIDAAEKELEKELALR